MLIEKSPVLGGMPVRYLDLFPNMECGPCMLEPVLGEVLQVRTPATSRFHHVPSEVTDVAGYYGNFTVKVRQAARYVDPGLRGMRDVCCALPGRGTQ